MSFLTGIQTKFFSWLAARIQAAQGAPHHPPTPTTPTAPGATGQAGAISNVATSSDLRIDALETRMEAAEKTLPEILKGITHRCDISSGLTIKQVYF